MHSEKAEKVSYYNTTSIETIEFIELLRIPFSLGNALKYLMRCNSIDPKLKDIEGELDKIMYYINRELKNPQYTEYPNPGYHNIIGDLGLQLKEQLPDKLYLAVYWLFIYIKCNKLTENKNSKELYLTNAIKNVDEYKNEIIKNRRD